MAYWNPLRIDGQSYDLSHLEPFEMRIIPRGWSDAVRVSVHFHDHCFTEKFDPARHSLRLVTPRASKHEHRAFDYQRYSMSLQLPKLIRDLDNKRIRSTRNGNLVRIELADGKQYGIFFTLKRKDQSHCTMYVVSAYPFDNSHKKIVTTGEMKFNVALSLVLQGKRPKFPETRP